MSASFVFSPPESVLASWNTISPCSPNMPSSERRYWSGSALTSRMCSSTLRPAHDALVLLRVVAERHLVAERDRAEVGLELADERLEQRRLARAVEAEHEHPLAAADVER